MAAPRLLLQGPAAIIFFLLVSQTQSTTSPHAKRMASRGSCVASEREALLSLKQNFSGFSGRLSSWRGKDCCRWKGVGCSNRTDHVVTLDLRLTNDQMEDEEYLGGEVSSIVALHHLRYLDLSNNGFDSRTPSFLGNLKNLRYLNLSNTFFRGGIPPQLGNLSSLHQLDLSYSFSDPTSDLSWLRRLPLLTYLDMSEADLSSARDWVHDVNMLPALEVLLLSDCMLHSTVYTLSQSNLTRLEVLDLTDNYFDFPLAHNWFWDLPAVKSLLLDGSGWSGPIPDALGNMSSLEVISLYDNCLSGNTPTIWKNLCNLQKLYLGLNNINGSITELMERLPKCSRNKVSELTLNDANLTGELPVWIGNLTNLSYLDLSRNMLVGHVPGGIGALSNLTYLGLGWNNLSGVLLKEHFVSLVNLEYLNLSRNSLKLDFDEDWIPPFRLTEGYFGSCDLGPQFPTWLRWQTSIVILDISDTSISDDLPHWFWAVVSNASKLYLSFNQLSGALPAKLVLPSVVEMDLSRNSFSGQIPRNLTVPGLRALHLHNNHLTGIIPACVCQLSLHEINLSNNHLTGTIPACVDQLSALLEINLSNNHLTGTIPACFCQLGALIEINLSNNQLTGDLPRCLQNSSMYQYGSSLSIVDLKNNNLSGEFPRFFQNATRLLFLDLSHNKFAGRVPTWIAMEMPYLLVLILRSNMFYGNLPRQLRKLGRLHYLDIAHNNISGGIPTWIASMTAMTSSGSRGPNNFSSESISTFIKDQERNCTFEFIGYMVLIDLSCNRLTGQIPRELSLLKGLQSLNLSSNQLSGPIPDNIGALKGLESLDLSYNSFTGEIPRNLSDLTFLSCLNLSYNHLSGRIPSGRQLQTINDPYMYIGNPGLCGPPLPNDCSANGPNPSVHEEQEGASHDTAFLHLSISAGFVVGLWAVFCTILFCKTWRFAYFRHLDQLYDKIYVQVALSKAALIRKFRDEES